MKYFFASDVHLGLESTRGIQETEKLFVGWLEQVHRELLLHPVGERGLFLVGDIFDFWFEFKHSIPKGFVETICKLREICRDGIDVYLFCGNHDMWHRDYFTKHVGVKLVKDAPLQITLAGKKFSIEHGDAVFASYKTGSKILHSIFNSSLAYFMFSTFVHSDLALAFGNGWSKRNRGKKPMVHTLSGENEPMVKYARKLIKQGDESDYYIFGHLHGESRYQLNDKSEVIVLGQWIDGDICYGEFDGDEFKLRIYNN